MLLKSVLIFGCNNAKKVALLITCLILFSYSKSFAVLNPGSIGDNQNICTGSSPSNFISISAASNGTGTLNYQWQQSTTSASTGFTDIVGATGLTYTSGSLTQTTYFRRAVSTINDAIVFSNVVTVTVANSSVGGTIYRSRNSCRGTDLTIFTLVGNVGNVIRWESSPSNLNPVWTTISNTTTELTLSSFSTTTYYRAVVQNGSCPIAYSSINFTQANPTPANGNVYTPPPGIACGGTNSFVFSLVAFTGTVLRWESSPSPGFSSPTIIPNSANLSQITVTNLTTTTYYRAITTTGNCSEISSTNDGKEILPPSVGGTIAGSDTVCSTTNSTLLTLSGHSGTILRWESSSDANFSSINTITNTTTTYTATNVTSTTYYRAVVKRGTCPEAYSSNALINVNTNPPAGGTISGGGTYCTSASSIALTLSGNTGNIVSWQSADDSAFTTNVTTINSTNNPLSVGRVFPFVKYYRALVNVPGCGNTYSSFVKIIVVDQTVAGTSSGSTTFCSKINSHTVTLSGNVGTVLRWESSPNSNFNPVTVINNTTTTLSLTNIDTTTYYRAVVRNDSCDVKFSSTSIVTILTPPDAGILSGSDTICNSNNINSSILVLRNFIGTITKWQSSSNANFTSNVTDINTNNDSLLVTNISTTTYYRVIVSNGSCLADTSNIVVIMLNPASNGGNLTGTNPFNPNVVVCTGTNSSTLLLSSHVGTILKWQSSPNSDFSIPVTDIANTSSTYLATNLTSTTYYRVIVKSGICEADTSNVRVITVNPLSDAGTLNSDTVCLSENSTMLRLSNYVGSIVKWERSTVANFSSGVTNIANTSDSLLVINLLTTTYYRVIVKSGVCSADTSSIGVIVTTDTTVGGTISGPLGFCRLVNSSTLTLTGHVGTIIEWQSSTTSNFSGTVTSIPNTANLTTYTAVNLSVTTYYRALLKNGECASAYSSIKGLFSLGPFPNAGTINGPSAVCISSNAATLTLSGYSGSIIKWQSSTTSNFTTNVIDIANTTSTLNIANISTSLFYRAIVFNGPTACEDTSAAKEISINTDPIAGILVKSDTVCAGANSTLLRLTNYTGTIVKWESSTSSNFNINLTTIANTSDSLLVLNLNTTTYYRAIVKNGVCADDTSTIAFIKVDANTIAGNIINSDTVCAGVNSTLLQLTNYTGTIVKWESSSSSNFNTNLTTIANTSDSLLVLNLNSTTYYRAIVKNGVCTEDTSSIAFIKVDANTMAGDIIKSDTVCAGVNSTLLRLTNYTGTILRWESSSNSNFNTNLTNIANTTDSLLVLNLNTTTYYRAIVKNGVCTNDTSTIAFIKVDENTVAGTVINSDTVCAGVNSILLRLTNYTGTIVKWESSSSSNFNTNLTTIANTSDSLLVLNLNATTYYRAIIKNGVCADDTSTVAFIKVDANTIAGTLINSDTVCAGTNSTLLRLTNYTGTIVKWESSADSNFNINLTTIANTTDSLLVLNLNATTYYRAIVKNGVCAEDTSTIAFIKVDVNTAAGTIINSDTVCAGTNSTLLRLTNYTGTIVKWESSADSNFNINLTTIANTTDSLLVLNLNATTYYRAIVKNGICAEDTSSIAFIQVLVINTLTNVITAPIPDSFFVSGNPDTIIGSIANADTTYIRYVWQLSTTSDTTGFNTIIGLTTKDYNPDTITQTTWYRRIAIHYLCGIIDTSNVLKLVVFNNGSNPFASIGVSLSVQKPVAISPGVYHVVYTITLKNYGNLNLENIRLTENLNAVFPAPSTFSILSSTASNGLQLNANFDGTSNLELLDPAQSTLSVSELKTVRIKLQLNTNLPNATYVNQVFAFTNAVNTTISVIDTSVDGDNPDPNNDGNPNEQSPTIINIEVFVPTGFSPNGDNKNDEFVIIGLENYPNNRLEIYNRWGNLVFEQAPYDNNWKGSVKNSDAIVFGDGLLPSGTYFYLLDFGVPGVKQQTGYIVIRK